MWCKKNWCRVYRAGGLRLTWSAFGEYDLNVVLWTWNWQCLVLQILASHQLPPVVTWKLLQTLLKGNRRSQRDIKDGGTWRKDLVRTKGQVKRKSGYKSKEVGLLYLQQCIWEIFANAPPYSSTKCPNPFLVVCVSKTPKLKPGHVTVMWLTHSLIHLSG